MSNGFETCDKPLHCIHGFKTDCPYCRIAELEEQNERDRCHGRDFVRRWKESKERIAELEQELTEIQTAYDELRLLADGRLSIKPEYVRVLEKQLARYQGGIEVEGIIEFYPGTKIAGVFAHQKMPDEMVGQRVRVLDARGRLDAEHAMRHQRFELERLKEENSHLWVRVESGEAAAYEQGKAEARKQTAQEIIQYIIDQGMVDAGNIARPMLVYEIAKCDIEELRQRYGLEG